MATVVSSIGLKGIEGYCVQVEVLLLPGTEGVSIVGLPDASVKESKDRVMAALTTETTLPTYDKDFKHVLGHKQAKRALEIAVAGGWA
jgi:predicted ATPase with chaperone activity